MPDAQAPEELRELLSKLVDGQLDPGGLGRLDEMLWTSPELQPFYDRFMTLHSMLLWRAGPPLSGVPAPAEPVFITERESSAGVAAAPSFGLLGAAWRGAGGYFSSHDFVLAYSVATVLFGIAMWLGSLIYVSHDYQVATAENSRELTAPGTPPGTAPGGQKDPEPKLEFVGQVSATADCRWAGPAAQTGTSVHLGGRYALSSGLVEIAYETGAKVILQGPCVYEVDSTSGGSLLLGRLTARVTSGQWQVASEERSEVRGQRSEHYPLATGHYPLFSVRTPSAIVTDLGTEFGVEVDRLGATRSHVFRGKVELRAVAGPGPGTSAPGVTDSVKDYVIQLGADESASVAPGSPRVVRTTQVGGQRPTAPGEFVRRMPRWTPIEGLFNTGVGLKEGQPDPHWQLVARSDDPKFKPRQAVVTRAVPNFWFPNNPSRSQWLSTADGPPNVPGGVVYTFRTTFELVGLLPDSASLRGLVLADNYVSEVRLNGRVLPPRDPPPENTPEPQSQWFNEFIGQAGFVEGTNTLEIDVMNTKVPEGDGSNAMGLRVELSGHYTARGTSPLPAGQPRKGDEPMNGP